ncbi:hypothetical protein BHE74_00035233 [Ensete ventricosum]|nr:hypothetical protein BHE74_00035233 [Ensete ventricosum]
MSCYGNRLVDGEPLAEKEVETLVWDRDRANLVVYMSRVCGWNSWTPKKEDGVDCVRAIRLAFSCNSDMQWTRRSMWRCKEHRNPKEVAPRRLAVMAGVHIRRSLGRMHLKEPMEHR